MRHAKIIAANVFAALASKRALCALMVIARVGRSLFDHLTVKFCNVHSVGHAPRAGAVSSSTVNPRAGRARIMTAAHYSDFGRVCGWSGLVRFNRDRLQMHDCLFGGSRR